MTLVLLTSVALLKMSEMEYCGTTRYYIVAHRVLMLTVIQFWHVFALFAVTNSFPIGVLVIVCSYFMKLLMNKKYALPYRVLDGMVAHFVRFTDEERDLPVIWHQCLLTFVQR